MGWNTRDRVVTNYDKSIEDIGHAGVIRKMRKVLQTILQKRMAKL